jgi:hypothetical protein
MFSADLQFKCIFIKKPDPELDKKKLIILDPQQNINLGKRGE